MLENTFLPQVGVARRRPGHGDWTGNSFPYPGATPSISASGASNAILWSVESGSNAVWHAYDANNLANELYSNQASGGRDQFGAGNKFITPTVANGTINGVFGLLH
jgi:hypothetical protein